MDVVKTDAGYISGTVLGEPDKPVHVYRGIPYAAPPVGDLRWKPPQPVAPWSGIRECTVYSIQPAQFPDVNLPEEEQKIPSNEDCLYLNVLTPAEKAAAKLPVMVWFHGGGLRYGTGNWSLHSSQLWILWLSYSRVTRERGASLPCVPGVVDMSPAPNIARCTVGHWAVTACPVRRSEKNGLGLSKRRPCVRGGYLSREAAQWRRAAGKYARRRLGRWQAPRRSL
jgi:hypothetical protein